MSAITSGQAADSDTEDDSSDEEGNTSAAIFSGGKQATYEDSDSSDDEGTMCNVVLQAPRAKTAWTTAKNTVKGNEAPAPFFCTTHRIHVSLLKHPPASLFVI